MTNWSDEEINNPLLADDRNFYNVEKRTKAGCIERMLWAGSNLDHARMIFDRTIKHRPRVRLCRFDGTPAVLLGNITSLVRKLEAVLKRAVSVDRAGMKTDFAMSRPIVLIVCMFGYSES
jgi:hypothetical protein